jgi:hypothetical protein
MKFACYFRPNHIATGTKVGTVEATSVDEARSKAEAKLKTVYPNAILVDVCDEAERVEPADRDTIYAFFWKENPRGRINGPSRVVAESREAAIEKAKAALASAQPGAIFDRIVKAINSPVPVKNARGIDCAPSLVY